MGRVGHHIWHVQRVRQLVIEGRLPHRNYGHGLSVWTLGMGFSPALTWFDHVLVLPQLGACVGTAILKLPHRGTDLRNHTGVEMQ